VAGELLLDTGGLVSLIDRHQPAHASCVEATGGPLHDIEGREIAAGTQSSASSRP
jgi:hypothetical protein